MSELLEPEVLLELELLEPEDVEDVLSPPDLSSLFELHAPSTQDKIINDKKLRMAVTCIVFIA